MKPIPPAPVKKTNYLMLSLPILFYLVTHFLQSAFFSTGRTIDLEFIVFAPIFAPLIIFVELLPALGTVVGVSIMYFGQDDENWFKTGILFFIGGVATLMFI